jgi:hypothetical protein
MSDSWWVFTPAAGFKAERNCLSRSRFDHQKAVEFYAELCLPGAAGGRPALQPLGNTPSGAPFITAAKVQLDTRTIFLPRLPQGGRGPG